MVSTRFLPWVVSLGIFGLGAYAGGNSGDWQHPVSADAQGLGLLPVREEELFPHLRRRADDLSRLHPQDEVKMFFGKAISESHVSLANMTVTKAAAGHPLLLLENFDDLTENITCTDNDTKLALKFLSKNAMDTALKAWDWVNQDEKDFFFLITHHHHMGCGVEEERTPYKIVAVRYDQENLTATLTKEAVSWDEALQNFELNLGTAEHPAAIRKRSLSLRRRDATRGALIDILCRSDKDLPVLFVNQCEGLKVIDSALEFALGDGKIDAIVDLGAKVAVTTIMDLDPFKGESGTASFSIGKPDAKERKSLTVLSKGVVEVKVQATCVGCFITGNIEYKVFASRKDGGKVDMFISVTPNVKGKIMLEVVGTISKEIEFNLLAEYLNTQLKTIAVGSILKVAPEVLNGPGIVLKGETSANVTLGFEFTTGNASVALSVGANPQLLHKNWNAASATPSFQFNSAKLEAHMSPYWRFGIGFGVDVIGKARVGAFAGFTTQLENVFKPGRCESDTGALGLIQQESTFKVDLGYKLVASTTTGNSLIDGFLHDLIPQPKDGKSLVKLPLEPVCKPV
ncbi:hypothetical protein DRE_01063 [Drechslerella stenobrocha 248]|uniref:DUF7029 domain-containing protein n=1 Tax=Drechslerella stenobrocha 248 TaxID=1043628 RepID=W7HVZ9_9PEZI|nr:hypothetical protein DRE_01063 [Drechslerella stenobrocha 248]